MVQLAAEWFFREYFETIGRFWNIIMHHIRYQDVVDIPSIRRIVTENRRYFQFSPNKDSGMISSLPNRPRSIYQYSSMAPRLSGQNCKFFKFLLSLNSQRRLRYEENNTKYRSLTWKPRSHVRILIYRTWPITGHFSALFLISPPLGSLLSRF